MANVTSNISEVVKDMIRRKKRLISANERAILKVALAATTFIKERTLKGRDTDGKFFKEYATQTLKQKRKRGGRHFTGKVDLFDKGHMMASLQAKKKSGTVKSTAVIGFTRKSEQEKASRHVNGVGVPKRNFFWLNEKDKSRFFKQYEKNVLRELK